MSATLSPQNLWPQRAPVFTTDWMREVVRSTARGRNSRSASSGTRSVSAGFPPATSPPSAWRGGSHPGTRGHGRGWPSDTDYEMMMLAREPGDSEWPSDGVLENLLPIDSPYFKRIDSPFERQDGHRAPYVRACCERCDQAFDAELLNNRATEIRPRSRGGAQYSRSIRVAPDSFFLRGGVTYARIDPVNCPCPDRCLALATRRYVNAPLLDWVYRHGKSPHLPLDGRNAYWRLRDFPWEHMGEDAAEAIIGDIGGSQRNVRHLTGYTTYLGWRYVWIQHAVRGKTLPRSLQLYHMWGDIEADLLMSHHGLITPEVLHAMYGTGYDTLKKVKEHGNTYASRQLENLVGISGHIEVQDRDRLRRAMTGIFKLLKNSDARTSSSLPGDVPTAHRIEAHLLAGPIAERLRRLEMVRKFARPAVGSFGDDGRYISSETETFPQRHLEHLLEANYLNLNRGVGREDQVGDRQAVPHITHVAVTSFQTLPAVAWDSLPRFGDAANTHLSLDSDGKWWFTDEAGLTRVDGFGNMFHRPWITSSAREG